MTAQISRLLRASTQQIWLLCQASKPCVINNWLRSRNKNRPENKSERVKLFVIHRVGARCSVSLSEKDGKCSSLSFGGTLHSSNVLPGCLFQKKWNSLK